MQTSHKLTQCHWIAEEEVAAVSDLRWQLDMNHLLSREVTAEILNIYKWGGGRKQIIK